MPLKMHLAKHKPKCNPYYYLGNRQFIILMARLRMRCSELRQHLFDMNIIENKNCKCGLPETTSHFFSRMPTVHCHKAYFMWFFLCNNYEFTVHVLLYGISDGINNFIIKQAAQEYVIATNRFNCWIICHGSFNNCHNYSWFCRYINDLMYNAFVQQYHTTLFTCQATIVFIFFHRKRSLDYNFVLLQLVIKYVYTKYNNN